MRIKILGKLWDLRFVRSIGSGTKWGECDSPEQVRKQIRIDQSCKGEKQLEILLHEMLHASDWSKDEEWVSNASHDIAHVLWRLGYRLGEG